MGRWDKELRNRLDAVAPSPKVGSNDEFDAIFGEKIEQTLTEYRLMVTELLAIKGWLQSFARGFFGLSILLIVALALNGWYAYQASAAQENNKLLHEHACLTYEAYNQIAPEAAKCPPGP